MKKIAVQASHLRGGGEQASAGTAQPLNASSTPAMRVGRGDHRLAPDRVEQPPEQQRPEEVAEREGQQVEARLPPAGTP